MSHRVTQKALKGAVAVASLMVVATALSGCNSFGGRTFGDPTITGSTSGTAAANLNQPMPASLGASQQVAEAQFIPPANIGGGNGNFIPNTMPVSSGQTATVTTQTLPPLGSQQTGNLPAMPAQQTLAPVTASPAVAALSSTPSTQAPNLSVVPSNAYVHTIQSGESLYTIARKYDVTAQSIVQANGSISPDKIYVGQKLVIPGRADLLASKAAATLAPGEKPLGTIAEQGTSSPVVSPATNPPTQTAAITDPSLLQSNAQPKPQGGAETLQSAAIQQPASTPKAEPTMSGADKFRWPVSGKVITDFASSKATGINIEAPEGAAVKAAENGTVIYVGAGVEGYGNLILIRHPNGYVSAYAHLKSMSVAKGDVVNRGDTIGATGMTGSVNKPQLHFELRKGATPVDPIPLLAS